jgi:hypothetical protein
MLYNLSIYHEFHLITRTMLSSRGAGWAKVPFAHGEQDAYHPVHNPRGIVMLSSAENVGRRSGYDVFQC